MKKLLRPLLCLAALLAVSELFSQKLKTDDSSQNAGKVEWVKRQIDAGKVPFGVPVSGEFEVKNISSENLIILDVRSGCHCTVVEWTREPIQPGKSGIIKATYDAQREGDFYRIITAFTNFDPAQSVPLALVGKIDKQEVARN